MDQFLKFIIKAKYLGLSSHMANLILCEKKSDFFRLEEAKILK